MRRACSLTFKLKVPPTPLLRYSVTPSRRYPLTPVRVGGHRTEGACKTFSPLRNEPTAAADTGPPEVTRRPGDARGWGDGGRPETASGEASKPPRRASVGPAPGLHATWCRGCTAL